MDLFRPREYIRPTSIKEATDLIKKYGKSAAILAGGTDLLVAKPPHVEYIVDITRLPLSYIDFNGMGIRIGSLTTIAELEFSRRLKAEPYEIIARSAYEMGTPITKNMATIGGNICNAAPSAEMPPSLLALDAETMIVSSSGRRKVSMEEFFVGPKKTCLRKGELLKEIFVPRAPSRSKAAFMKKGRTSEDIAQVNVAVRITVGPGAVCNAARIALGAVAPTPIRAKKAESVLVGEKLEDVPEIVEEVAQTASGETRPISDVRASVEYRREITKVLVKRALESAVEKFNRD
jgi:carbon-monoxide dehydrogenase medium subunit